MKIMPILFSESMVRAILEGRKTMTRRVIKPQPCPEATGFVKFGMFSGVDFAARFGNESANAVCDRKPKYCPGDLLWVRETWAPFVGTYLYKANGGGAGGGSWRPSIFMPRTAARLFLRVTDVRVERLQKIAVSDVLAEGIESDGTCRQCFDNYGIPCCDDSDEEDGSRCGMYDEMLFEFADLWEKLYGKRGYGWGVNPWVWAYTFERIEKPERWCQ